MKEKREPDDLQLIDVTVESTAADGSRSIAVDALTLNVSRGEWVNIVGVNGSGKSTLARLAAGLYVEGASGVIRRGFAGDGASPIVLQQPDAQLFGETPREDVLFALEWRRTPEPLAMERTEQALRRVGLATFADAPWDSLSGGQRQLAAAAAAIACDSPLLVFDEATSMLDERNRAELLSAARALNRSGTAVVWVTQRLDELLPDDRTIAMADGRLAFDGGARAFLFGSAGRPSPCAACGVRLPYMAELAIALRAQGALLDPLPVTPDEWNAILRFDAFAEDGGLPA